MTWCYENDECNLLHKLSTEYVFHFFCSAHALFWWKSRLNKFDRTVSTDSTDYHLETLSFLLVHSRFLTNRNNSWYIAVISALIFIIQKFRGGYPLSSLYKITTFMHYKTEDIVVNFIDIKAFRSLTSFLNSRYLQNNAITQLPGTVFSGPTNLYRL